MTTKLEIWQQIVTSDDSGTVDAIDGDMVTVRWDSLVVTTQPVSVILAAISSNEMRRAISDYAAGY